MARKNKGWDYLNSDDVNSMLDGNKDDWGYTDSDGSGSFHGGDGSWGHRNADGSGSYYGADGSWGHREADGSGSFYDADGSWGHREADGSVSYYGADGSWGHKKADGSSSFYGGSDDNNFDYDEDDEDDSSGSSLGEAIGTIIGAGIAGVMAAGAKVAAEEREREARREAEEREKARIRSEKRRAWRKKHWKGITITILIFIMMILGLIGYYEMQKLIPIGYSSESLEGLKYTEVVQKLKESGFSNVHTKKVSDLTISREDEENLVTEVKLMFSDSFDEDTKYPSNLWVTVVYHTVELYTPPLTSKEAKGMNYSEVVGKFEDAGFTNVTTDIKYDIITGWLTDDGEVESVTINGEKKFDYYDEFRLDAEVVVTYHTLKKNKSK